MAEKKQQQVGSFRKSYIREDGVEMCYPHTFEIPPPTRTVDSITEMSALELIAFYSRRAKMATPDYWPNVILRQPNTNQPN